MSYLPDEPLARKGRQTDTWGGVGDAGPPSGARGDDGRGGVDDDGAHRRRGRQCPSERRAGGGTPGRAQRGRRRRPDRRHLLGHSSSRRTDPRARSEGPPLLRRGRRWGRRCRTTRYRDHAFRRRRQDVEEHVASGAGPQHDARDARPVCLRRRDRRQELAHLHDRLDARLLVHVVLE
jgi:hypothetical protein